ncbi:hypothetical protein AAHA92_32294 [Salvia divinorum]|uniref:DUF946 domain-containing protein n=1 Tax=Salvia divinorum TaxID=28513 RepID=A0ABD1FL73_SALDI
MGSSSTLVKFSLILTLELLVLAKAINNTTNSFPHTTDSFPIDTNFIFPSPIPNWPQGGDFATGEIDLGGLKVQQISGFNKIWSTEGEGPNDAIATFFEPFIPDGFSMLSGYAQPNNRPLLGWALVAKATDNSSDILKQPTDYTLVWSNGNTSILNPAYFWLPIPPDGYKSLGLVVTTSPEKPSPDKIRCVRSDFTADAEMDDWIWGNVYGLRPKIRGAGAQPVSVGAFAFQNDAVALFCLINTNPNYTTGKLNGFQMDAMFQAYAPYVYFHPKEKYLPTSTEWFFDNGALLYMKGQESNPVEVESGGLNLPTGG